MQTARRSIHIGRDQWHLHWDRSIPPVARMASGETVDFDLADAACGQIEPASTVEAIRTLDFSRVDQVNGPLFVEGALPGDTLEVEIVALETANWGWTAVIPGFGLLAEEFTEPRLKISPIVDGMVRFAPGINIPAEPFCGEIGLAPGTFDALSTIPPYRHGGNLDTKHLTAGTKLYLPVEAEGALFSIGDGHAAQGDGEVCGTAIETPMHATVRLTVHKDYPVSEPEFLTAGPLTLRTNTAAYYAVDGIAPDLREASQKAIRHMIGHLVRSYSLCREDAYMLCSVAVDLKICEVVDAPNWLVGAFLPLSIFQ